MQDGALAVTVRVRLATSGTITIAPMAAPASTLPMTKTIAWTKCTGLEATWAIPFTATAAVTSAITAHSVAGSANPSSNAFRHHHTKAAVARIATPRSGSARRLKIMVQSPRFEWGGVRARRFIRYLLAARQ
jgi:hypothetical protein